MALYFFDINDGESRTTDDVGHEFADDMAARDAAVKELSLIIRDSLPDGKREAYVVIVRDKSRRPLWVATATLLCEPLS